MGKNAIVKVVDLYDQSRSLALRPTFFQKVNPAELGWYVPNGEIVFQSNRAAMKFANNQAVKALKAETPFERAVVVKDNVVKRIFDGDSDSVYISGDANCNWSGVTIVHGHPDDMPISVPDARTLIHGLGRNQEIIALNSAGEYSKLRLMPLERSNDTPVSHTGEHIVRKKLSFLQKLKSKFERKRAAQTARLSTHSDSYYDDFKRQAAITQNRTCIYQDYYKALLPGDAGDLYKDALKRGDYKFAEQLKAAVRSSPVGIQRIHEFWKRNAARYGLEYETNFSNLTS